MLGQELFEPSHSSLESEQLGGRKDDDCYYGLTLLVSQHHASMSCLCTAR
jgi:hypothetical protein